MGSSDTFLAVSTPARWEECVRIKEGPAAATNNGSLIPSKGAREEFAVSAELQRSATVAHSTPLRVGGEPGKHPVHLNGAC